MLADSMKLGLGDEAFLSGLMHDIGIIVEIQYDRQKLIDVITKVDADPEGAPRSDMLAAEIEVFGASHQDFGIGLCQKWKFPKSFANVTGYHHNPLELPDEARNLACIVSLADRLAASISKSFRLDLPSLELPSDVLDYLKMARQTAEEIRVKLPTALEAVEKMMN
jgi:HD-like signal output (HDOD) protein